MQLRETVCPRSQHCDFPALHNGHTRLSLPQAPSAEVQGCSCKQEICRLQASWKLPAWASRKGRHWQAELPPAPVMPAAPTTSPALSGTASTSHPIELLWVIGRGCLGEERHSHEGTRPPRIPVPHAQWSCSLCSPVARLKQVPPLPLPCLPRKAPAQVPGDWLEVFPSGTWMNRDVLHLLSQPPQICVIRTCCVYFGR